MRWRNMLTKRFFGLLGFPRTVVAKFSVGSLMVANMGEVLLQAVLARDVKDCRWAVLILPVVV